MSKLFWKLRAAAYLWWAWEFSPIAAWMYSDALFDSYGNDDYSPIDAALEDATYWD